jgi:hypothetical protein
MRQMVWDTQRPDNVSRRVWLLKGIDTYVHEHNDDVV